MLTAVAQDRSLHVPIIRATPSASTDTFMPRPCQLRASLGGIAHGLSSPLKWRMFARAARGWKNGLNVCLKGPDGAMWRSKFRGSTYERRASSSSSLGTPLKKDAGARTP